MGYFQDQMESEKGLGRDHRVGAKIRDTRSNDSGGRKDRLRNGISPRSERTGHNRSQQGLGKHGRMAFPIGKKIPGRGRAILVVTLSIG